MHLLLILLIAQQFFNRTVFLEILYMAKDDKKQYPERSLGLGLFNWVIRLKTLKGQPAAKLPQGVDLEGSPLVTLSGFKLLLLLFPKDYLLSDLQRPPHFYSSKS